MPYHQMADLEKYEVVDLNVSRLLKSYKATTGTRNRLFLLDYDGTLTPIVNNPDQAIITDKMFDSILNLARNLNNVVWIVSGRDRKFLDKIFGKHMGIGLCAEHGAYSKAPGEKEWTSRAGDRLNWKAKIVKAMEKYTKAIPGSFIEPKDACITWHYRLVAMPRDMAKINAYFDELCDVVGDLGKGEDGVKLHVKQGKMIFEVKPGMINKGVIARELMDGDGTETKPKFVLAAGDDTTDEDMFRQVGVDGNNWSLYVGTEDDARYVTASAFRIDDCLALGQILSVISLLN